MGNDMRKPKVWLSSCSTWSDTEHIALLHRLARVLKHEIMLQNKEPKRIQTARLICALVTYVCQIIIFSCLGQYWHCLSRIDVIYLLDLQYKRHNQKARARERTHFSRDNVIATVIDSIDAIYQSMATVAMPVQYTREFV